MGDKDKEWEHHLRSLSSASRDSADAAADPSLLNSVKRLCELCKSEKSEELVDRVYPHLNKIFQRCVASISQTQTSSGLLLLIVDAILVPNMLLDYLVNCLLLDYLGIQRRLYSTSDRGIPAVAGYGASGRLKPESAGISNSLKFTA